jgi:hypothetical protein
MKSTETDKVISSMQYNSNNLYEQKLEPLPRPTDIAPEWNFRVR